ncbi:Uu.00g075840.m01.CDS01 [Anthostomella pinea]|uniref:Uu.00g075840.m01.CDS01 n=1 Tax=Anthostomella pinea TaxID=933095 RepID=A0AAI8YP23_9PEZI|nr:Uu.00g075840.m01.CDS01 [Anthostomella pinea]
MRTPTASKPASLPLKRIVSNVEVERKFNPGPKFASRLRAQTRAQTRASFTPGQRGSQGALTVRGQPSELIRDTYYDTKDGHLSKLGLWVRQRHSRIILPPGNVARAEEKEKYKGREIVAGEDDNGKVEWNAKLRVGDGDFVNSQFIEIDGRKSVVREVLRVVAGTGTTLRDLGVVADLVTRRASWDVIKLADGTAPVAKMTIVVDAVSEAEVEVVETSSEDVDGICEDPPAFGHSVGEVELFQPVVTEGMDAEEHKVYRKEIATRRMEELEAFMLAHAELFETSPLPIGKLAAYYGWKEAGRTTREKLASIQTQLMTDMPILRTDHRDSEDKVEARWAIQVRDVDDECQ